MSATMSVKVREWSDPLGPGEDANSWPPPDAFAEYLITGQLADMVRARTGEVGDVYFVERTIEGGYSEYSIESDFWVTVSVGSYRREFAGQVDFGGAYESAIPEIQRWLTETPEPGNDFEQQLLRYVAEHPPTG